MMPTEGWVVYPGLLPGRGPVLVYFVRRGDDFEQFARELPHVDVGAYVRNLLILGRR